MQYNNIFGMIYVNIDKIWTKCIKKVETLLKAVNHSFSENIMKQTPKQKSEIEKKQMQVNGSPKFENGHLVTPVMDKKNKVTTPEKEVTETKKPDYSLAKFLAFVKKNNLTVVEKPTKSNNIKIRNDKKILFYAHQGKKDIILWNNISKKTVHVSNESDLKKLIATV